MELSARWINRAEGTERREWEVPEEGLIRLCEAVRREALEEAEDLSFFGSVTDAPKAVEQYREEIRDLITKGDDNV